jgi:hypothetical protein
MGWVPVFLLSCFNCGDLALQGTDCNRSGVDDAVEIAAGDSLDCNGNGRPDECEIPTPPYGLQGGPTGIEVRPELRALRAADVNGDGLDDLLEVYRIGRQLAGLNVHHAMGNGTFATVGKHELVGAFASIEAGDLDGDGDIDVVASSDLGLGLVFNTAGLTSELPEQWNLLTGLGELALGNVTGDDLSDLAVGAGRRVVLIENQGAGAFGVARELDLEHVVQSLVLTDIDGDGLLDVAASGSRPGELSVLRNAGGELWDPALRYPTAGRRLIDLRSGDLNGDGAPELVVSTFDGLSVLWNQQGEFNTLETLAQISNTLNVEDVDGDGDRDLLAGDLTTRTITPILSNGTGGLAPGLSVRLPFRPGAVVVGEFDGNGRRDVLASENDAAGVALLRHGERKDEGLLILRPRTFFIGDNPHSATMADFNGDGILDIIESGGHGRRMVARLSLGGAALVDQQGYLFDDTRRLFSIDNGDFDRDGDIDVVMADSERDRLRVLSNRGDGVFENPVDHEVGKVPMIVFVHDVDNDGWLDFVSAGSTDNTATVLFGGEDGAFASRRTNANVGTRPLGITAADLDDDGFAEVIVPNFTSRDVSILRNQGGRTFAPQEIIPVLGTPRYATTLDADGSGSSDVVVVSAETNDVAVFLNDGEGRLGEPAIYPLGREPYSVVAADVNGDGVLDLCTANWRADSVSVLQGVGDGRFVTPDAYDVGQQPRFVFPGDFDRDGDLDLVSANYATRDLTWLVHFQAYTLDVSHLSAVCTEFEFSELAREGEVRFLTTVDEGVEPTLLFENTRAHDTQREFIAEVLPERFGGLTPEAYARLVGPGGTYMGGLIRRRVTAERVVYGFGLLPASSPPAEERPAALEALYVALLRGFSLKPLAYLPEDEAALELARSWTQRTFAIVGLVADVPFRRGDVAVDGRVNLLDAVAIVEILFGRGPEPPCLAAADTDGDGRLAVIDAIGLLGFLFRQGAPPVPPTEACGTAVDPAELSCAEYDACSLLDER